MQVDLAGNEPILVFGGPYSNLQATDAMRAEAERRGIPPSHVICTGDIVAYCAAPDETARCIAEWGCLAIQGNCEESLAERADNCGCGFAEGTACDLLSKGWYAYADAKLSDEMRQWMRGLPRHLEFTLAGKRGRVIHGGVNETSRFIFASTDEQAKNAEFDAAGAEIIIGGHCGLPFIHQIGERLWFNPGVIGMPANDATADGWYGLIEPQPDGLRLSLRRLNYDATLSAQHLREAGFAPAYADALESGLWPSLDVLPALERSQAGIHLRELSAIYPSAEPATPARGFSHSRHAG